MGEVGYWAPSILPGGNWVTNNNRRFAMRREVSLLVLVCALTGCARGEDGERPEVDVEVASTQSAVTTGCSVVQTPPTQGANPLFQINPKSSTASDYTRPMFPSLIKAGSWSSTQWVVDANGLALPAITASGSNHGFMALPFNSGETVIGVTLTVCGDATTNIIANTMASQFSIASRDNSTDALLSTGSTISSGTQGIWHDVDIGMLPLFLSDQSTFWLDIAAQQATGAPSMAVARVLVHLNH